eukprot:scaffold275711_cov15-Tisochrysis_lutea.AAC.1
MHANVVTHTHACFVACIAFAPACGLDRSNSALPPVPPPAAAAAAVNLLGSQSVCTVAHTCR